MEVDPRTESAKTQVSGISFLLYLLFLSFMDSIVYVLIRGNLSDLMATLIITGINLISFGSFYVIINWLYDKTIFRYFQKVDNLTDTWYQFHLPKDYDLSSFRFGKVEVEQQFYHINMQGENHGIIIRVENNTAGRLQRIDRYAEKQFCGCSAETDDPDMICPPVDNKPIDLTKMSSQDITSNSVPLGDYIKDAKLIKENIVEEFIHKYTAVLDSNTPDVKKKLQVLKKALHERIKEIDNNVASAGLHISIDSTSRFTTWTYETAYMDIKNSRIDALFKAHSAKPDAKVKSLCPTCKDQIQGCKHCHDFKTEEVKITQQSDKYGGHFIFLPQNQTEPFLKVFSRAKKLCTLTGEFHNMLPNNKGEGTLKFFRATKEIADLCPIDDIDVLIDTSKLTEEQKNLEAIKNREKPRQILDALAMFEGETPFRKKKDKEERAKKYIRDHLEFEDNTDITLSYGKKKSSDEFYEMMAKYVAILELKQSISEAIRFNLEKHTSELRTACYQSIEDIEQNRKAKANQPVQNPVANPVQNPANAGVPTASTNGAVQNPE